MECLKSEEAADAEGVSRAGYSSELLRKTNAKGYSPEVIEPWSRASVPLLCQI